MTPQLIAKEYDQCEERIGSTTHDGEIEALVVRMDQENCDWG